MYSSKQTHRMYKLFANCIMWIHILKATAARMNSALFPCVCVLQRIWCSGLNKHRTICGDERCKFLVVYVEHAHTRSNIYFVYIIVRCSSNNRVLFGARGVILGPHCLRLTNKFRWGNFDEVKRVFCMYKVYTSQCTSIDINC